MQCYTYIYIDPRTDIPFYVGKGSGNRAKDYSSHNHNKTLIGRIQRLRNLDLSPNIEYFFVSDDFSAKWLERCFISAYGRKDQFTGCLLNHTDGGEGTVGFKWSDEAKQRMSNQRKGRKPWNLGKSMVDHLTTESLERMKEGARKAGKKRKGCTISENQKLAIGKAAANRKGEKRGKFPGVSISNKQLVTCPYCKKTGMSGGMRKHHFDRCKQICQAAFIH